MIIWGNPSTMSRPASSTLRWPLSDSCDISDQEFTETIRILTVLMHHSIWSRSPLISASLQHSESFPWIWTCLPTLLTFRTTPIASDLPTNNPDQIPTETILHSSLYFKSTLELHHWRSYKLQTILMNLGKKAAKWNVETVKITLDKTLS